MKILKYSLSSVLILSLAACGNNDENNDEVNLSEDNNNENVADAGNEENNENEENNDGMDYAGSYEGVSWRGESDGVTLDEATQKIETELTLDSDGTITDVQMVFLKDDGDGWYARQDTDAEVAIDFDVDPTPATPESENQEYEAGNSMFEVETADMMSFYAVGVSDDNTVAFALVEPYTRYMYEYKLDADFDFSTPMGDMTIGEGLAVPTVRTSGSGITKPEDWEDYSGNSVLDFSMWMDVITKEGMFQDMDNDTSIQEFLEAAGVNFENDEPAPMDADYGFFGLGGWNGNYVALSENLIGENALEKTSIVDWDDSKYADGVNDDNQFGVDEVSGATRTVQNSIDGISGATVRISRESASYQRALVEAGILDEEDVVIGRF